MNIVACVKRVPTTDAVVEVTADGKGLKTDGLPFMISFYDEIALEQAVLTKEALGGEVTVLTLGPAAGSKEIRECLAKGADKAVILADDEWLTRDCRATAKALTTEVQALGAELVFVGKVATDRDNGAVGLMMATWLGWACVNDVVELELSEGKGTAKVETEAGLETVEFSLPAVIGTGKGLNDPRYAGLKGIMAAKKKPLEEKAPTMEANQARTVAVAPPSPRAEGRIVGQGADAVPALIDALRNEAQVL
jgi:electron transfer flavoprotein beta subunit